MDYILEGIFDTITHLKKKGAGDRNDENQRLIGVFVNNFYNKYTATVCKGIKTGIDENGGALLCFMGSSFTNQPYMYIIVT